MLYIVGASFVSFILTAYFCRSYYRRFILKYYVARDLAGLEDVFKLSELKIHLEDKYGELRRAEMHKMWHENMWRAVKPILKSHTVCQPYGVNRILDTALESLPEEVRCPACNHKGAEWHLSGHDGNPATGIQCMECLDVMGAPFWDPLELENQPESIEACKESRRIMGIMGAE